MVISSLLRCSRVTSWPWSGSRRFFPCKNHGESVLTGFIYVHHVRSSWVELSSIVLSSVTKLGIHLFFIIFLPIKIGVMFLPCFLGEKIE